jgi:PPIC-type PPIASE domain
MRTYSRRYRVRFGGGLACIVLLSSLIGHRMVLNQAAAQSPQTPPKEGAGVQQALYTPLVASNSKEVVAYIYGTMSITREQLGEYLIQRMGAERLNNLVNRCIIEQAARERGVEVTATEVEADLAETLRGFAPRITLKDFESKILKPRNKTLYEWKEDVIKPKLLLAKMCKDNVKITDKDLHDAFEAYYGEKVDCKIIMWPKAEQHIAMAAYPKIRDSEEEFDRVARSQASPSLASQGGHIQPIARHTTGNEVLEKAIFGLEPGEMTAVLDTPEGYVVAKCVKRIPPDTSKHLENEREKLSAEIHRRRLEMIEIPKLFQKLHDEANPKIVLKHDVSEEELLRDTNELLKGDDNKPKTTSK